MDELRELAVRTALFEHLDDLLLASDDDTLGWNQTESFQFNGEAFSIRQTRGRGISKPAKLNGALSITTAFTPFGKQPPYEDLEGDGYPRYQSAGNAARDAIAAQYPGAETEVTFQTELGARRVDVLTSDGLAIESKVGYTSLNQSIQTQIAKDQLLVDSGDVSGVQWAFSRSDVTGKVGPSDPLALALDKAGIPLSSGS